MYRWYKVHHKPLQIDLKMLFAITLLSLFNAPLFLSQTTIQITSIEDVFIDQTMPSLNFGSAAEIKSKPYSPGWSQRFMLKADLSNLPNNVEIIEAKIKLSITNYLWANSNIGAYRMNEDWDENSITWSSFSNNYNDSPSAQKSLSYPTHSLGDAVYWDVTSDVQGMQLGVLENYGWFFRDVNLSANTQAYWNFASSENSAGSKRPVLEIKYSEFTPLPVDL